MEGPKAVLVTGASTGIGRAITNRLAAEGHFVYAGARKDADLRSLEGTRNVCAVRLDVTNPRDIAAAVKMIAEAGRGLYGLVNNAGVATFGSVMASSDQEFDLVMAVNVRGVYCTTKAFAPLITPEKGRIVMIGSISGILAEENISAYSMSKHAVEAFTDSLALEMAHVGVQVSVLEPGTYSSSLCENMVARGRQGKGLPDLSRCDAPHEVASAVACALFDRVPKRRYLVVSIEDEARRTIRKQIEQLVQLNEAHAFSYARDALIEMLDEELERSCIRCRGDNE